MCSRQLSEGDQVATTWRAKQNTSDSVQCRRVGPGGTDTALSPALHVTAQLQLASPTRLNVSFPFYRSNAQGSNKLSGIFADTGRVNLTAGIHTRTPGTALGGCGAGAGLEGCDRPIIRGC